MIWVILGCALLMIAAALDVWQSSATASTINPLPFVPAALASFATSAWRFHRHALASPPDHQALFTKGEQPLRMTYDHERAAVLARWLVLLFLLLTAGAQIGTNFITTRPEARPRSDSVAAPVAPKPVALPARPDPERRGGIKRRAETGR
jgi:hypothetical protein